LQLLVLALECVEFLEVVDEHLSSWISSPRYLRPSSVFSFCRSRQNSCATSSYFSLYRGCKE
jgi:hypothetical protein